MDDRDKELDALRQLSADVGIPIVPLELKGGKHVPTERLPNGQYRCLVCWRSFPAADLGQPGKCGPAADAQFLRSLRIEPLDGDI